MTVFRYGSAFTERLIFPLILTDLLLLFGDLYLDITLFAVTFGYLFIDRRACIVDCVAQSYLKNRKLIGKRFACISVRDKLRE